MMTEDEMKSRGEEINPDDAIVMIPRVLPPEPPPAPVSVLVYLRSCDFNIITS